MITKVLIANRGEVAVRIARACRDYGVRSVAVYADPDAQALHVQAADEAWALEGQRPADTYLDMARLLHIARRSGADAVHPGYGFLSERADFAQAVLDAGLVWIGPPPAAMAALGDKVAARRVALQVGAPLVAGTPGPVQGVDEVRDFARRHGLPVAIKAAHGGGGRGLKVAWHMDELEELYASAVREAQAAFGRGECYVEQFLDRPRHIEAQILADRHGQVVVVGTRDCSLQRRHQKLVEEAPAPFLSDAQRARIHQAARDICAAAGYRGAGTVEFLLGRNGQLSFLEVNTRLQVEHPVTEETTGVDLVLEQLRMADGLALPFTDTPPVRGHSIEFRINAEDPGRGYLPTPGRITQLVWPGGPGVRIDSGVAAGSSVPGVFDSLLAKVIVTGATRAQALARARRALAECHIEGVATVLPFHRAVVQDAAFTAQDGPLAVHTRWIETDMAARFDSAARPGPEDAAPLQRFDVELDGKRVRLGLPAPLWQALPCGAGAPAGAAAPAAPAGAWAGAEAGELRAPLAGSLVAWRRRSGDAVQAGEAVAVLEAMKMETTVTAPQAGTLECLVDAGTPLAAGQLLARVR